MEESSDKIESAKFVVLGSSDCGKTSTVAVLEKNVLDNGNGSARSLIVKIKHERESGRTSSHSCHYILKQNEITTLIDLCGHEKYLKTTMFGVMGMFTDYGILVLGANNSIGESSDLLPMVIEHLSLLISNRIPFIIIISKIDICPPLILQLLKKQLQRRMQRNKKELIYFESDEQIENSSYLKSSHLTLIESLQERKTDIIPVIMSSNKTGHNINFIREFITELHSEAYLERKNLIEKPVIYPSIMFIDSIFCVSGIGTVLSGTVKYADLHLGQKVIFGPLNNTYINLTIKSMQNCISENVQTLRANESGSIGIRLDAKTTFTRDMFSKGQIITTDYDFAIQHTCLTFECEVSVFNHMTTIQDGYQTVIHLGTIRQAAKFKISENRVLRSTSREIISAKFIQKPEFILEGSKFMFRDGRTKGMGRVGKIIPFMLDTIDHGIKTRKRSKKSEKQKPSKMKV